MFDAFHLQHGAEHLRFFDGCCANQYGLFIAMCCFDLFDHGRVFFGTCAINPVIFVNPCNRAVGGHFDHAKAVNLAEFLSFGQRGAGHASQLIVEPEIVLERNRG